MVKSHHLYHSSHSDRQSKHILKSQFVCRRVCPGWGALWWVSDGDAQTRAQPRPFIQIPGFKYSKCYKRPKRGIETKHFAKFWRIRGSKYDISIFFSHTEVKLYQFSKDLKGGQNGRILRTVIYSQYPPRGCLSIFWKGYWVYGVLFLVPRVSYRNLSVVWIWKLSVLVMWCKHVKTFRSERLP